MIKKTDKAIALFNSGDHKGALGIAKGFKLGLTSEETKTLARGYECFVRPDFYESLGHKAEQLKADALMLFYSKWIKK